MIAGPRNTHLLIDVRDDVCDCRTRVLDLDSPIRTKGIQCHRAVVVQPIFSMLPLYSGGDTLWVGRVGLITVHCLFEEAIVGAEMRSESMMLFSRRALTKSMRFPCCWGT